MNEMIYFETLAGTVRAIAERAEDQCVLVDPAEIWALCERDIVYGQTRRASFEIRTIKGKPTRKHFHAVICRLDSGRYELTTYIL